MDGTRIVVKYHNPRMLLTVELNALFATLFKAYGDGVSVEFAEMDERGKAESTEAVDGLRAVRERFQIFETGLPAGTRRRKDLEEATVAVGIK